MQVFTSRTSMEICRSQLDLTKLTHTNCVQFGKEALLIADESDWNQIVNSAGRSGISLQRNARPTEQDNLYLVVQKGRLFQQEHPEAPVLIDKGRFLVVDLNPELVESYQKGDEPCYGIKPLEENMVVFREQPKAALRRTPQVAIQDLITQLSRSSVESNLTQLVSWSTRYSTSNFYRLAAEWSKEQLETMGYDTRLEDVTVGSSTSQNVIADREAYPKGNRPGNDSGTKDLILVIAHLDSINIPGGADAIAPGADDNGSGSAGLLEIAKVFKTHQNKHDLRLMLLGGEEQGLFGSKQYVASLDATERARIKAVLNMDMIGTLNTPTPTVLLEGAPISQAIIDALSEAAATYTELTVQTSLNPFASDHVSFIEQEIPAVLTIEGADSANNNIHSANDTLDRLNYDFMLEILRMNVAFIANEVGQ
ncbi:MAG: M28 family metallopeptidase [Waterburya sp.]